MDCRRNTEKCIPLSFISHVLKMGKFSLSESSGYSYSDTALTTSQRDEFYIILREPSRTSLFKNFAIFWGSHLRYHAYPGVTGIPIALASRAIFEYSGKSKSKTRENCERNSGIAE